MIPFAGGGRGAVLLLVVTMMVVARPAFLRSALVAEGARCAAFLDLAPLSVPPTAFDSHQNRLNASELIGEDKRKVPTGANPLHNR